MATKKTKTVNNPSSIMFESLAEVFEKPNSKTSYYFLIDDIDQNSAKEVISWIMECNFSEEKPEQMTLFICSGGGEMSSAFAIIDIMRGSSIPIATVALGEVASAGLMISMAGKKGQRVGTPNTLFMSHIYSAGSEGKHHELMSAVTSFNLANKLIHSHYELCTGLDIKTIKKKLLPKEDVHLSAEQALEYGLIDVIKSMN
jgi:ATP-dependent Clp endopeptidase proteolytic subunit ClpP